MQDFLAAYAQQIPKSLVIDLGYNAQLGWFVLELNASWGAGLNGCNAQKVLPAIINSTQNLTTE